MLRLPNDGLAATVLKTILPRQAGRYLRAQYQSVVFTRAMNAVLRQPLARVLEQNELVQNLIYGWGNQEWSALDEYLVGCVRHTLSKGGPILECGSGLSTLMLGLAARETGTRVHALEHHPEWGKRVQAALDRWGIDSVELSVAPLKSYGEFTWYDPPLAKLPASFALVSCDGPPESTPGGRYGLLPVMKDRFGAGTCILLDDAERDAEKSIAERWTRELGLHCELAGVQKPYFVLTVQH